LQKVLNKTRSRLRKWPIYVQKAAFEVNRKVIIYFGYVFYKILSGFISCSELEIAFPTGSQAAFAKFLKTGLFSMPNTKKY